MVKCLPEFEYFSVFLKNKNIIFKIRRSKVTEYAALNEKKNNKKRVSIIRKFYSVNSEIFARVLFSRNFEMAKSFGLSLM